MMKFTLGLVRPVLSLIALAWAGSAHAQGITNAVRAAAPAAPAAPPHIWLTFGLDRLTPLQYAPFAGIPLWQYVASLTYIFLAFYLSRMLDQFVITRVRRWSARTATTVDDKLVELIRGPVKLVVFVILLHVGIRVYSWPDFLAEFISKGLQIIVAVSITYVVLRAVDLSLGVWHERTAGPGHEQFGRQLFPLVRKTVKVFVVVVAILVTSQNLGFNVTGLIASLSIGGLALGLAAQDTLANLFGAVSVLLDRPFQVGDRIQVDNVDGTVESIGFRSTRVRNLDGYLITIPNKTMGNATITNISARPNIKTMLNVGITYDTTAERVQRAIAIIDEVFRPHPMTADLIISFDKFESSSLNILVVHWWNSTDFKAYLVGFQELNIELKRRFDAEGIAFAFPTQTLYLKQDSEFRLAPAPGSNAPQRG